VPGKVDAEFRCDGATNIWRPAAISEKPCRGNAHVATAGIAQVAIEERSGKRTAAHVGVAQDKYALDATFAKDRNRAPTPTRVE